MNELDRSRIWGPVGFAASKKENREYILEWRGIMYDRKQDGDNLRKLFSARSITGTPVHFLDERCIIVHSSLVKKFKLTFDENGSSDFYGYDFSLSAKPHFIGYYQPQLLYDVGFYSLDNADVIYRQIELAKRYGLEGFCFYYYLFSGDRLLEKPLFNYLKNTELDFPFCLCWANESWSRLWDAGNKEVIKEQNFSDEDNEIFFHDILPFFKDEQYIKINNKPVLLLYRSSLFPKERILNFVFDMRRMCKEYGFDGIYFMKVNSHNDIKSRKYRESKYLCW